MKIIGKTKSGFILEASRDEVENLMGFYSMRTAIEVGDEIKVSEMFQQLYSLARKEESLKQFAKSLRGIADLLEISDPVVTAEAKASAELQPK